VGGAAGARAILQRPSCGAALECLWDAQQSNPPDCYQRVTARLILLRITTGGTLGLVAPLW
jgi:hypothetical protein